MKNFKKQLARCMAVGLSAAATIAATGCGGIKKDEPEREDISYLYVSTRDAGLGDSWLISMASRFEEKYKDVSFEEGKKGVIVETEANRSLSGTGLLGTIESSTYNVFMIENMNYVDYMANNLLYDLSDTVTKELDDGSGTILSKMGNAQKEFLTGYNGNYYALPWFSCFNGVTYNAGLFAERELYFAAENGLKPFTTSVYTGEAYTGRGFISAANPTKSCGPDGISGTFDDGLPSSYEEFFYLLEYMTDIKGVDPFVYTGASEHYLNYMFQSLVLNWAGAKQVEYSLAFDSGDDKVRIITSFDSNDNPIVEEVQLTEDNGYLASQLEAKYYATKFMMKLFDNESDYFYSRSTNSTFTNLDAQTIFINSNLNSKYSPIGMMIEGNYWYQEANSALTALENKYGERGTNLNLRFMPLPAQETGTVEDGKGKTAVVGDGLKYYMVVNGNIKSDPVKCELAELFVQFCYEDASLQDTTLVSSVPIAVDYELETEQYNSACNYAQSVWDIYTNAIENDAFCNTVSGSKIFMANWPSFGIHTNSTTFKSTIAYDTYSITYGNPRAALKEGVTAKEYFLGLGISESTWNSNYNIYK